MIGEKTHITELRKVQKELESLRERITSADLIKHENVRLRSEIEEATKRERLEPIKYNCQDDQAPNTKDPTKLERSHIDPTEVLVLSTRENERLSVLLKEEKEQSTRLHRANVKLKERCKAYKDQNMRWQNFQDKLKLESAKGKATEHKEQQGEGHSRTPSVSRSPKSFQPKSLSSESDLLVQGPVTRTVKSKFTSIEKAPSSTDRSLSSLMSQYPHQETTGEFQQSVCISSQDSLGATKTNSSETCDESHVETLLPTVLHTGIDGRIEKVDFVSDDESDVPVIVSERSLKRKRRRAHHTPNTIPYQDTRNRLGSVTKPISVKSEQPSSSPSVPAILSMVDHAHDSLDLDEIRDRTFTPRKKRWSKQRLSLSPKDMTSRNSHLITQVDQSTGPLTAGFAALTNSTNRLGSTSNVSRNRTERQSLYNHRAHERQSRLSNERLEAIQNEAVATNQIGNHTQLEKAQSEPVDAIRSQHSLTKPSGVQQLKRAVLQPTTPNTKVFPRTYASETEVKSRICRIQQEPSESRLSYFTEDGENFTPKRFAKFSSRKVSNFDKLMALRAVDMRSRLDHLLKEPSPEKPMLHSAKKASAVSARLRNILQTPNASNTSEMGAGNILPEHEALRSRPLDCLSLYDFRINPSANQGIEYAFNEVVRNQDQRRCMPNCTKPGCCGEKFRKIVEIGGLPTPLKSSLWASSPAQGNNEDENLLEDCLGISRDRISWMSESTKQELLIEAKAKYFANEHGRHRQNHDRASTPPGFWRTDMPTTQEEIMDREKARKEERQKVEERYREAMRVDGRWKFRDE